MKRLLLAVFLAASFIIFHTREARAGELDILVNKLVEKKVLTPAEAQIILDETKAEVAKEMAKGQAQSAPEWTQKIKMKGDVRFRTQADWGKTRSPANAEVRERIRARFGIEGKVNDSIYGGGRLVTGGSADPRSTNITLGNGNGDFSKTTVMFDQYYIRLEPHFKYIDGSKIWLGKFDMPFNTTELFWDNDMCPEGIGLQYMSPVLQNYNIPATTLYANGGMFWVQELNNNNNDPLFWAGQFGFISELYPEWGTKLNAGMAFYAVHHQQGKTWTQNSAGTNSLYTARDAGSNKGNIGTLRYDYDMFDLLVRLDNNKLFGYEVPKHGFYSDFIYNSGASSGNTGYLLGVYLGEKKIQDFGQWYTWFEWRYLERDCVPDIFPDSDFYGFSPTGYPGAGGTNAKGINLGVQIGLFKNTYLNLEWNYSRPIKALADNGDFSKHWYQLFQADINVKF